MLNAFRHHGEGDNQRLTTAHNAVAGCSTPFGITARGTGQGRVANVLKGVVLNAFRHHGEGDPGAAAALEVVRAGAQRLSASRRGGPADGGIPHRVRKKCSTPFGITARGTEEPITLFEGTPVLNAFRHHGEGDHPASLSLE